MFSIITLQWLISSPSCLSQGAPWHQYFQHRNILCYDRACYDSTSWTIIFSIYFPSSLLYYGHLPFAPCNSLKLDLPSDTKARTRCLADCAPPPLSITCLTLAFTVPPMRASVPADVHPLCLLCAHISSLLPYVSLHLLCMLPDPLTCVVPCPLYALS